MRVRLKGVLTIKRKLADGSVRLHYYHRETGKRIDGRPGTVEFVRSFGEAAAAKKASPSGDIHSIIEAYEKSTEFAKLSESTRKIAIFIHGVLGREYGKMSIEALEERDRSGRSPARAEFLRWHETLARTKPRAADNNLGHLQRILSWAEYRHLIGYNPLPSFKRSYRSNRADLIWLPEHIASFTAAASKEVHAVMMLALHTGQRQGDLIKLPWSAYDGTAITLRQGKDREARKLYIPCTQALKTFLDNMERAGPLILMQPAGKAWHKDTLRHHWNDTMEAAGISDLHFHDLRGTAATKLAEAGCTTLEIASITGHSYRNVDKILERYLARTRVMAENAIAKLERFGRDRKDPQ